MARSNLWTRLPLVALAATFLSGFYGCPERPELSYETLPSSGYERVAFVDPKIGSGGFPWARGNVSPAASAPFGRVKVGPDTTFFGKHTSTSGYASNDTHILGFSHTRLSGTGAFEGGLLRVLPLVDKIESVATFRKVNVLLDDRSERSFPGYYSVYLPKPKVQVELSATQRTAIHRYRFFGDPAKRYIYLDLSAHLYAKNSDAVSELAMSFDTGARRIRVSGKLKDAFSGRYQGLPFYFEIESDDTWDDVTLLEREGEQIVRIDYPGAASGIPLQLRMGLSYVGQAGAERVLTQENLGQSFAQILTSNGDNWKDLLDRIEVEGGTERERKIFYTALYHSFLMPDVMDDPNGANFEYPGFDKTMHTATHPFYSDFSLWDTFRTLHPLYNLILKDKHPDMINSLLLMADQSGILPRWPSGAGNTGSMLGLPGVVVMAEAAQKALPGWDQNAGFDWAKKMTVPGLDSGQEHLAEFLEAGYCSTSVSHTLEYAYGFEALAQWSRFRSEAALSEEYHAAALGFKNHWSSKRGLFVPKSASGVLDEGISESDSSYLSLTRTGKFYVEGTAWHWAFSPFILSSELYDLDPSGLHARLNRFFESGGNSLGAVWPIGGYWHGNEHDFHATWIYALTGRPDLSQKWVDFILRKKYQDRAMGLDGDDDGGALSSWYVWSAMGLFPVAGTDRFVLGAPIFDRVLIHTDTGETLEIQGEGKRSAYVKSAELNSVSMPNPWITEVEIQGNALLKFQRSATAHAAWGNP